MLHKKIFKSPSLAVSSQPRNVYAGRYNALKKRQSNIGFLFTGYHALDSWLKTLLAKLQKF